MCVSLIIQYENPSPKEKIILCFGLFVALFCFFFLLVYPLFNTSASQIQIILSVSQKEN